MKNNYLKNPSRRIVYFFLIAHGIPFLMTGIFMMLESSVYISNPILGKLIYIGLLSPTFAALFVLFTFYIKKERREYWLSIIDFKRIPLKWYLVIFSFPILFNFLASIIDASFILSKVKFNISPQMTLAYAINLLFFGPIPEELGWRGIAFPELQKKFGFIIAVSLLGFMWAIWHLPLFLVKGTYQYQLGLFTPLFWSFMFGIFFHSVIYGVVYNQTNKSILAVILLHYFVNLTGETFETTFNSGIISTLLQGILALSILIYCKVKGNKLNQGKQKNKNLPGSHL